MTNTVVGRRLIRALAVTCAIGLLACAWIMSRSYRASSGLIAPQPADVLLGHPERTGVSGIETVTFDSPTGAHLKGWYVPSRNRAAIIVTTGTNSDRSSMLAEVRLLSTAGFGVLVFDWPGLGESTGPIRWDAGAVGALVAAVDWMSTKEDVDSARIGGLGFSIGGIVMARVAAVDLRLRALVLEGTPASTPAYMTLHYGRWHALSEWPANQAIRSSGFVTPGQSPAEVIASVAPRPLFLISGDLDREIPADMVRALYASASEPKTLWVVPGAGHGGYSAADGPEYARRVIEFFSSSLLPNT